MIEGWDPKHLWIRVCMQAARKAHFAWSLTDTPELVHLGIPANSFSTRDFQKTKCSNLSSRVCCVVFETRMVSIQERIQTP